MRRILAVFCALAFAAAPAAARSPKASASQKPEAAGARKPGAKFTDREGQVEFASPSKNIGCVFTPAGGTTWYKPADDGPELSCDRVKPDYVNVRMGPSGEVQRVDNPGEQPCCAATNILAYGKSWSAGPFTCVSGSAGIGCKRADGRGFAMSKKAVSVN